MARRKLENVPDSGLDDYVDYRFCFGEKAASSSVSRMNRLRLSLVVYVAFDYAFAVSSHGFAIVSSRP